MQRRTGISSITVRNDLTLRSERGGSCYPGVASSILPPQPSTLAAIILPSPCHYLSLGRWAYLVAPVLRPPQPLSCQLACRTRALVSLSKRTPSASSHDSPFSFISTFPHRLVLARTALQHRLTPVPPVAGTALPASGLLAQRASGSAQPASSALDGLTSPVNEIGGSLMDSDPVRYISCALLFPCFSFTAFPLITVSFHSLSFVSPSRCDSDRVGYSYDTNDHS